MHSRRVPGLRGWRRGVAVVLGVALLATGGLAVGLSSGQLKTPAALRALLGSDEVEVLRLAAVYTSGHEESAFVHGIRLAVEEVNAQGGVNGLPLELVELPEEVFAEDVGVEEVTVRSMKLASRVTGIGDLLAVIGHERSATAIPASGVYNRSGVLYLATHATASSLTARGFDYVFGLQPNNADNAAIMARYAMSEDMRRFVVLSDKTAYGMESANFFSSWAAKSGGEVVYRGFLPNHLRSLDKLMIFMLNNALFSTDDYDAIYLVGSSLPQLGKVIHRARTLGLDKPILGADYVFQRLLTDQATPASMKGVAGVSLYDRESRSDLASEFIEDFVSRYGNMPDMSAALGYDAVKLLRDAAERAGTVDSKALADTLRVARYEGRFQGVTGTLAFDVNGLITDVEIFVVRHDGNDFAAVRKYRKPLNWSPIKDAAQPAETLSGVARQEGELN